jgi:nucleoside-diphosphate-sugar epimerase
MKSQRKTGMNILLTAAASPLAQRLAEGLRGNHTVRLTERVLLPNVADLAVNPLGPDLATNLLVRGMEAIVHVAEPLSTDDDLQAIDYLTRCTYNLCRAAVDEGVRRLVFLSTLELMSAYDPQYIVTERWRPQPTPATPLLNKHLGELVCREFAREHKLDVVVLRLGQVVQNAAAAGPTPNPTWVAEADVVQAVERALTTDTGRWAVFHIQHESPTARFSIATAKRMLGFTPGLSVSLTIEH